ncbi:MAG: HEPN domain-containing protein [Candidatus Marinimicrobia bacterium]|nr:HEPN domain-containing protein [Candidatus Neomarinimicrobiota bacterium]
MAYLDIGEISTKNENNTGEYQNAVAYQLYHALELFVKYLILKKTGNVKNIHDFSELFSEYDSLYPDDEYRIEHPFDFTSYEPCELNVGEQKMYENHINKFKPKFMDQHLRYPPDNRTGGFSYKIDIDYFKSIKEKLMTIYSKINC